MIKLFVSDIDGTLTDGTVFVSKKGEELKQFSLRDGRGFLLIKQIANIKTCLMTSESGGINKARAEKMMDLGALDFFYECEGFSKLDCLKELCREMKINLSEVAYVGDDTNDYECLEVVGYKGCPYDGHTHLLNIKGIKIMQSRGGHGAVREFIEHLIMEVL